MRCKEIIYGYGEIYDEIYNLLYAGIVLCKGKDKLTVAKKLFLQYCVLLLIFLRSLQSQISTVAALKKK
jgi:hypothetical protein